MNFREPQAEGIKGSETREYTVAPWSNRGGTTDLIRKRKRAFYRAYNDKRWHPNVLRFIMDVGMRRMASNLAADLFK